MQPLLYVFIEPDSLAPEFENLRTRYALAAMMVLSAALFYPNFIVMNALLKKQMASLGVTLSQGQMIASMVGGFFSQAIGLLVKWAFNAFFILTVAQFVSLKRKGEDAPEMTFKGVLRIVAYSSLLEIAYLTVKTTVLWIRFQQGEIQTVQDANLLLGLNVFFYKSDIGAFFYALFGEINPFNAWLYGVMGYLLAEIYKLKQGGVYGILFGLWLLLALLTSSFALLGEKFSTVQ